MDTFVGFLTTMTPLHWVALGLVLFGVEMALGTFDLLWIAVAAFATALASAFAPFGLGDWQGQLTLFAAASVALVILGRTVFAGLRRVANFHPTLNKRMDSLIGRTGVVASDFTGGAGRVKLGDTEWGAEAIEGVGALRAGDTVVVESTRSTTLKVRRA
ncbi:MAG: NfeD family protein [Pseudomonadota bacterium]